MLIKDLVKELLQDYKVEEGSALAKIPKYQRDKVVEEINNSRRFRRKKLNL